MLQQHSDKPDSELSAKLQKLVAAVRRMGAKGSMKVTIEIAPASTRNEYAALNVTIKSAELKLPPDETVAAMFFADENGALSRNPPKQQPLALALAESEQQQEADARVVNG